MGSFFREMRYEHITMLCVLACGEINDHKHAMSLWSILESEKGCAAITATKTDFDAVFFSSYYL